MSWMGEATKPGWMMETETPRGLSSRRRPSERLWVEEEEKEERRWVE